MPVAPISFAARRALAHQHVDDRSLERRRNILRRHVGVLADVVDDCGLEPAEREVVSLVHDRSREPDRFGITVECSTVDRRSARIAEIEEPCHLVERLSGGVVDRLADEAVAAVILHLDEHRVTARHQQHEQRELERRILQRGGVQVRLHVVDTDERNVPRHRQGLGGRHADEERSDQTGTDGAGNGIDPLLLDARLDDRSGDHRIEDVEMRT
jgi:hypothetical protein